jgi:hypothetical protein
MLFLRGAPCVFRALDPERAKLAQSTENAEEAQKNSKKRLDKN